MFEACAGGGVSAKTLLFDRLTRHFALPIGSLFHPIESGCDLIEPRLEISDDRSVRIKTDRAISDVGEIRFGLAIRRRDRLPIPRGRRGFATDARKFCFELILFLNEERLKVRGFHCLQYNKRSVYCPRGREAPQDFGIRVLVTRNDEERRVPVSVYYHTPFSGGAECARIVICDNLIDKGGCRCALRGEEDREVRAHSWLPRKHAGKGITVRAHLKDKKWGSAAFKRDNPG